MQDEGLGRVALQVLEDHLARPLADLEVQDMGVEGLVLQVPQQLVVAQTAIICGSWWPP